VLSPPLVDATAPSHASPSQNPIDATIQTTITSHQISSSMPFSVTDFIMGLKTYPTMAKDCEASHHSF
jgi:hypothetical protein